MIFLPFLTSRGGGGGRAGGRGRGLKSVLLTLVDYEGGSDLSDYEHRGQLNSARAQDMGNCELIYMACHFLFLDSCHKM